MSTGGAYEPIFVAKQPIFDRNMDIWGHELLFRHSADTNRARITDADQATAKVIVDGFSLVQAGMGDKDKALVNFPKRLLLDGSAELLPVAQVVVEILETVEPEPEVVEACKRLKKAGYTLALDDFVGQPGYEPLLELADIVKVDVLGMDDDRVRSVAGSL
ncbi:MAG: EAL domain-containing protein, partial [Deltaproteobacteria bacterium]|nr:EAL domain-containing protein [Deltaproteobacteria bacterium]